MTTPWTLILVVALASGAPTADRERRIVVSGYASEPACLAAAIELALEAQRWRMAVRSFDCLPGNA